MNKLSLKECQIMNCTNIQVDYNENYCTVCKNLLEQSTGYLVSKIRSLQSEIRDCVRMELK